MTTKIAVLGLGAMGSRMAQRLLQAGFSVAVWNRSPAAAQALVAQGAVHADSPRHAAQGADFVISMVRDDAASQMVWTDAVSGAFSGMKPGAVAIESSTLSLNGIRAWLAAAQSHSIVCLEAPVSGSRPQAEAGQLVYLVGGDAAVLERALPVLRTLGGAVHHVGSVGSGALAKLATNALLGTQVAVVSELVGLLQRQGADVAAVLKAMSGTSAWAPVSGYLSGSMLAQDFRPQFPVELAAKDFGYVLEATGAANAPALSAVAGVFHSACDQGLGGENMTAVFKLQPPA
jgi:3-hydroxyisobutyrate dehydrogenase